MTRNNGQGTGGVTVDTTNSAAGGTAWDTVTIGGGSTVTYDTHGAIGNSIKIAKTSTDNNLLEWDASLTNGNTQYGRMYVLFDTAPSANSQVIAIYRTASGTNQGRLRIDASGTVSVTDAGGTQQGVSSAALSTGTLYRLEWQMIRGSGTSGSWVVNIYAGHNISPIETITSPGCNTGAASTEVIRFGTSAGVGGTFTYWAKWFDANQTAFPGPEPQQAVAATTTLTPAATKQVNKSPIAATTTLTPALNTAFLPAAGAGPNVRAVGAKSSSAASATLNMPAGVQAGDILIAYLESANQFVSLSGGTETWFDTDASPIFVGTAGAAGATRLHAYWARASQTNPTAPTTNNVGDHVLGVIIAFSGCVATGDPWDVSSFGSNASASTAVSVPGATTTGTNRLVVVAVAADLPDLSTDNRFSGWTNTDLGSISERADVSTNNGNGGGLAIVTGTKATAGAYGATTATNLDTIVNAGITLALKPPGGSTTNQAIAATTTLTPTITTGKINPKTIAATTTLTPAVATSLFHGSPIMVRSVGAKSSTATSMTLNMPAGVLTGDILIAYIETANEAVTLSGGTETWAPLVDSSQNIGTAGATGATRLTAYWARASQDAPTAPTTSSIPNHALAVVIAFSGCVTSGNPWDGHFGTTDGTPNSVISIPGCTTTLAGCLVVGACAADLPDLATDNRFSGWADVSLTSVTEQADVSANAGNGGGLAIVTGMKATPGATGNLTATNTDSVVKAYITVALKPNVNAPNPQAIDVTTALTPTVGHSRTLATSKPTIAATTTLTPAVSAVKQGGSAGTTRTNDEYGRDVTSKLDEYGRFVGTKVDEYGRRANFGSGGGATSIPKTIAVTTPVTPVVVAHLTPITPKGAAVAVPMGVGVQAVKIPKPVQTPVTPLVDYRLVLATRSSSGLGTPIINDVLTAGFPSDTDFACRWTRNLNAAGTLEFSLPIDACSPANFAPGQRELHLYRDPKDGTGEKLVWAGNLWVADVRKPFVRFLGMGFYEALRHREISDDFFQHDVEQLSIAWQLIDYTQTQPDGNLGITLGAAAPTTTTRTVEYCAEAREVISDALEDLAGADDGFDFEITPNKVWRTWSPVRGTDQSANVILDTRTNVVDLAYTIDATTVQNDVAGIGKKGDCEPITFFRAIDTSSRSAYGLMQGSVSRSDIQQDDDLITSLATHQLLLQSAARQQPTVRCFQDLLTKSPLNGGFDLGDTISLQASWGYATFSNPFRLLAYDVTFDRVGHEMMDLTLDAVIGTTTAPGTGFSTAFDLGFEQGAFE